MQPVLRGSEDEREERRKKIEEIKRNIGNDDDFEMDEEELKNADSKGKYIKANIIGHYRESRC